MGGHEHVKGGAGEVQGFSLIEKAGDIEQYRLERNGLDVLLAPLTLAPVCAFMITYRVGSRNERKGQTGATHFLEHLMFKGSERYSKKNGRSIFNVLQKEGARVNATTWLDRTNYYCVLPNDRLSLAVDIEADRMRGALLAPDEVESERTVILNELDRGENDPLRKLYQTVWSEAFRIHPYGHPTIGWRDDVERMSRNDLRSFYDTFYWPDNATISVIGDFDRNDVLGIVHDRFAGIPSAPDPIPEMLTVEPVQREARRVIVNRRGDLGAVMMAFKSPPASDADMAAISLLAGVLATGKSSRLYRRLVDGGLATAVSASSSLLRDCGLFYIYALLAPGAAHEEVESCILEELVSAKLSSLESEELERIKALTRADVAFDRDGPYSMASSLNEAIAAGDWKLYASLPIDAEKVTAREIASAAERIFHKEASTTGYFIPE